MENTTTKSPTGSPSAPASQPAGAPARPEPISAGSVVTPPAPPVAPAAGITALPLRSVEYLSSKLDEAELLLGYAAEVGIHVEDRVRAAVLQARAEREGGTMTQPTAAHLLAGLATLAVKVRPVTVESLRACAKRVAARTTLRFYGRMGLMFACLIVIISLATFVSAQVAGIIKRDVETANGLAAKLSAELGPPPPTNPAPTEARADLGPPPAGGAISAPNETRFGPGGLPRGLAEKDVITDLQQFAATMRGIDGYARQLNHFVLNAAQLPYSQLRTNRALLRQKFELRPGLPAPLALEFAEKVAVYQEVRSFGNSVQELVSVYYGAIASCILPVLYALLGAGAYLLRSYEDQIKSRTFVGGDRHAARYLIAGIGGLVVGQFNFSQVGASSPLAVAFLVGYAADVFFAFLEGLLQMFKRGSGNSCPPGTGSKSED